MSKKVLITSRSFGQVSDEPLNILKDNGFEVDFENGKYEEEKFLQVIGNYDALIIGAHEFSQKAVEKANKLKIVCKHGAGTDNIDLKAAKMNNLRVTNVPAVNSDAVADLAFSLMLDIARKVSFAAGEVKKGVWEKTIGIDVCYKTLGLIGFGTIAKKVAKRAGGFGMKVVAYDPYITKVPAELAYVNLVKIEEVLQQADFLSIHVPLNDETRNLIDKKQMEMMKKGSFIINTSRGGIVNEKALFDCLKNGQLSAAGLDVMEKEPPTGNPLLVLNNITILPHIGMYSKEAINAVSLICSQNVVKVLNGQQPENIVI
ncbi:MAG TPA: hydroxyacid dehydrogenase [Firmicutes bacterium]|jgi:D-3-phosphoglycerate dehydrogenase / 2-oxoglutarate reductase|nr:hydroxyacid dehydrogenase [Bacillota bacterium]